MPALYTCEACGERAATLLKAEPLRMAPWSTYPRLSCAACGTIANWNTGETPTKDTT